MGADEMSPSQTESDFSIISNPIVDAGSTVSGKKRKLQADKLDLPLPKHVCVELTSGADPCCALDRFLGKSTETESSMVTGHSFSGDYDFGECSYASFDSKTGKTSSDESFPSTSITGGFHMFKDSSYSTGSSSLTKREIKCYDLASSSLGCILSKDYEKTQVAKDLNQLEFISSEFLVDGMEQLQDEEIQELLCSKDADAGPYLLSSARWSVSTQDAGEGTRKPTIDQEFEQYFSALMM